MNENLYFIRKAVTVRKIYNLVKNTLSYWLTLLLRKPIVWEYPPVVMIEPTNYCNLKCPLCPSGSGELTREKGYMDYSLYMKLIDEIKDDVFMLLLWNQGESFINKDFYKMVRYASDAGLYTLVSTNGHFLEEPEKILESGLSSLILSLDGASQETYNKYRINGNFQKVITGLRNLVEMKKKKDLKTPIVNIQFIIMRHNEHEIEEIEKIAREIGADKLTYKTVEVPEGKDRSFLPKDPKYSRYGRKKKKPLSCKRLWGQPVVNWNGNITPCCFDKDNVHILGSLANGSTFKKVWTSFKFNKFRELVIKDRKKISLCKDCEDLLSFNYKSVNI